MALKKATPEQTARFLKRMKWERDKALKASEHPFVRGKGMRNRVEKRGTASPKLVSRFKFIEGARSAT